MWHAGNGFSIRCWKDSWVLGLGPLLSYVPAHARLDLDCTLCDWVLTDRS